MVKSGLAIQLDQIEGEISILLKKASFKKKGRSFNRQTSEGLTHVIHLQMGSFDPPGTIYVPGLTQNLYGKFTVNCGVFIPEVAEKLGHRISKGFVQEHSCSLRSRLGLLGAERKDFWWNISEDRSSIDDVMHRLNDDAIPYFALLETRDLIPKYLDGKAKNIAAGAPPRIISAIIYLGRGEKEKASSLLSAQAQERRNPGHPAYVRKLADQLGIPLTP